jgi:hypothetical protein
LAELFLKLTPEEIYTRAERAGRTDPVAAQESVIGGDDFAEAPSFREIVERVTEALTAELALPAFDEWVAAYRSDPARYDEELLGLWRDPV